MTFMSKTPKHCTTPYVSLNKTKAQWLCRVVNAVDAQVGILTEVCCII